MAWKKRYAAKAHSRNNAGSSKKFGNVKSEHEIDGVLYKFDSNVEYKITKELVALREAGVIKEVIPHPPALELFKSCKSRGDAVREVRYNPDVLIIDNKGKKHYIDIKSYVTITADFVLKWKMCLNLLGVYVNIITSKQWEGEDTVKRIINETWVSCLSKSKAEKKNL